MKKILILLLLLINLLYSKEIIINSDLDDDIKKMLANVKSQNEPSSASTIRKGWYGGLGIGPSNIKPKDSDSKFGITVSLEFGYGINEDFLIYYSTEVTQGRTNEFSDEISEGLGGVGISYYINDNHYIKTTVGISLMTIRDSKDVFVEKPSLTGSAFNLGYGYALSKKQSLEITYTSLSFDKMILLGKTYNNIDDYSEIITFIYKYRWF